jgi:hypothetical protein
MPYIGTSPSNGVRRVFDYTATAGQTSFSGSDNNSQTLAYTDSAYIDVYQNGILLIPSDYVATTGTTVVLDTGATVSDTVQVVVYDVFSVADTVSASDGGSFGGNLGVGGTLSVTGIGTFSDDIIIGDGKTIGSTSDVDAMTISSGGVVTFSQTPVGAGGLIKLAKTTVTSATSLVAFDNSIITSAYDNYYITVQNVVPASGNTDLRARCSIDNGSNFVTHECTLFYHQTNGSNTGRYHDRTSIMISEDEHADSGKGINGHLTLFGVNGSTTKDALSNGFATNNGTSTHQYAYEGYTAIDTTSAINYIKIFGDQNISSGIFTIYGIVK